MPSASPLWRPVDWFVPSDVRARETDRLRRMRLLVVSIAALIPVTLWGAVALHRLGTLVGWQAPVLALSTVVLAGCLGALKLTGDHRAPGAGFCLYLVGAVLFVAATDYGLLDAVVIWAVPIPLIGAFVVGPWLAGVSAALLVGAFWALYALERLGHYAPPLLSTPAEMEGFTLLALGTAVTFSALLAWLYEGHTVRRLRRMNGELKGLRTDLAASEVRYRSLFDNVPLGVYRSTPDGRITMANAALLRMLGVPTLEGLHGRDARTFYEDPEGRARLLAELDRQGEMKGAEYTLVSVSGRHFHVRESARAERCAAGHVLYYEGVIEDVTAQREAEEAARRVKERYRALVQHSSDAITVLDAAGVVRYQSPSITRNLGYDPEQTIGQHMLEVVHPDDHRRVAVLFRQALRRLGDFGRLQFRARHADGHYVYVEATGTNMLDDAVIEGVVLTTRDVTEQKRAELALVTAKEQAEEVARLKSAFLTNMSHEIRTPLTGIIGFAGVLAEEVDDEHREFVTLIERSGQRLLQTLNSVLDLARLEADQMELDLDPLDVGQHVAETVGLLQPIADERGLLLRTEVEAPGALAELDAACLNRVVNNLVGNALKFTEAGAVTVTVSASPEVVSVAVADTGAGIDASFLPHLFDEFKQESSGLGRQHEGSGLGLTITRGLVELMGGRIAVESEKGVGTTFTVTFPRLGAAAPAPGDPRAAEPARPRVLVVDDNESTLALVERILRDLAVIDMAATADEALALADRTGRAYDLVLLDIHLGNAVSGTDLLRHLRAREAYARAAIVAFTAFALPGDRERFLNAGFDGYLGKPFTREEVRALMAELLPRATPDPGPADGLLVGTFVE